MNKLSSDLRDRDIELESRRHRFDQESETRMAEIKEAYAHMEESLAEAERVRAEAERASAAKSDFLAKMSHEIRTPLNGILGAMDMLLAMGLSVRQAQYAHTIRASSEVLLDILNGILDIAKIEAGRIELASTPFDPTSVIDDVAVAFGPAAHGKKLKLTSRPSPDLPRVIVGDAARVRQIMVNLVGNAIKFTDKGGIDISARWHADGENRGRLVIDIKDSGPGVPEQAQSRIFQRFEQGDGSMSRRFGGVGLGLAIARDLARRMGGDVELAASSRDGSTFRFWLSSESQEPLTTPFFPEVRALIAAPPTAERASLAERLGRLGVAITLEDRVDGALAALRAASPSPDLAIVDAENRQALNDLAGDLAKADLPTRLAVFSKFGAEKFDPGVDAVAKWSLLRPLREIDLVAMLQDLTGIEPEACADDVNLGLRILLAEDNPVNVEVTTGMLETLGCAVVVVDNGLAAADAAEKGHFDAILMDCQMPIMDGYEATRQIREQEGAGARTPVIAVTANAFAEDRDACFKAGMNDFLAKPITMESLLAALSRYSETPPQPAAKQRVEAPAPTSAPAQAEPEDEAPEPPPAAAFELDPSIVDQKALAAMRKISRDGDAMMKRVVGVFLKSSPGLVAEFKAAMAAEDIAAAGRHAHALKSASRNVGSVELPAMLQDVESLARAGDIGGVKAAASEVERAFDDLTLALETLQARG